jgi:hypothetical protein
MALDPPIPGLIFWPVGCGDSTTLLLDADTVIQIDLHHVEEADKDDDSRIPVVDELVELLPERDGKPYLAAFGATHLDKDHIQGFAELLDRVTIGDLWFTPRILWEQDDLADDAKAFAAEAERRINKLKEHGQVGSGDRIRIIGYHDSLQEHSDIYEGLPEGSVTVPGSQFTAVDGEDMKKVFSVFVHAPFKEDGDKERNDTSFGLQVTLINGDNQGKVMLLGDLAYPTVSRIFEISGEPETLEWNVFLAPHHCSRKVMYWDNENGTEQLQQGLLDQIENVALSPAFVVASSTEIPEKDEPGDNPPHADAALRYEELVEDGHFLCTAEYPSTDVPEPIVFEVTAEGFVLHDTEGDQAKARSNLREAVRKARGGAAAGTQTAGFGASRS